MTANERSELSKLARLRAKVAKDGVGQKEAALRADVESQLSARYSIDDAAWEELTTKAEAVVAAADKEIAKRCKAMGIRPEFRPKLHISWWDRGENAFKDRRTELRKAAYARIEADGKAAKVVIDRVTAEKITTLITGTLETEEAKAFLLAMPSIDDLMPRISLPELEGVRPKTQSELLEEKIESLYGQVDE